MDLKIISGLYSPEFIEPFLFFFKMLNNCNIYIFYDDYSKLKKYINDVLIVSCVVLYYISLVIYIIRVLPDTKDVVDLAYTAPIFMVAMEVIIRAAMFISKKAEIKRIIEELGAMRRTTDLTNIQLKKKNAILTKINVCQRVHYYFSMFCAHLYTFTPLLEGFLRRIVLKQDFEWFLPYPYPYDPAETFFTYIALYIFQAYSMFKCIYMYLGCEFLMVAICSHLVAEFTILREDILHLNPTRNNEKQNGEANCEINQLIKKHQKLINLSQRFDDSFNKINFVTLLLGTIIMCLFAFTAKVSTGGVFMIINYLAVVGMMVPLFVLCYFSQLLAQESSAVADSAYENSWYEGGTNYQKSICFIIARAQRPCCLTSLKYAPINLTTFSKVIRTTWSYFTLILRVYEDIQ